MSTRHQISFLRGVDKDLKAYLREIADDWDVRPTNGGHLRLQHRATGAIAFIGANQGDYRHLHNARATLKRALMQQTERRA